MSLLLDARKKSLQAQAVQQDGDSASAPLREAPSAAAEEAARSAGQNLFAAKFPPSSGNVTPSGRKLLLALGGALLLVGAGIAYWWQGSPATGTAPRIGTVAPPPAAGVPPQPAAEVEEQAPPETSKTEPQPAAEIDKPVPPAVRQPRETTSVRIERQHPELPHPMLQDAYLAYNSGKLDEAQQLYLAMLGKDAQSEDALLGLAAIAQQRGESEAAAHYYGRVLALDPRNAAANAGMSALQPEEERSETRLKLLLREQGDSAVLHYALGNLYAVQSRWGEAQLAYFNASTLEPGNAEFAYNLAVSLDHLGEAGPAVQHYRRALQLDRHNSAGFDHAQVERRIGELDRQHP